MGKSRDALQFRNFSFSPFFFLLLLFLNLACQRHYKRNAQQNKQLQNAIFCLILLPLQFHPAETQNPLSFFFLFFLTLWFDHPITKVNSWEITGIKDTGCVALLFEVGPLQRADCIKGKALSLVMFIETQNRVMQSTLYYIYIKSILCLSSTTR